MLQLRSTANDCIGSTFFVIMLVLCFVVDVRKRNVIALNVGPSTVGVVNFHFNANEKIDIELYQMIQYFAHFKVVHILPQPLRLQINRSTTPCFDRQRKQGPMFLFLLELQLEKISLACIPIWAGTDVRNNFDWRTILTTSTTTTPSIGDIVKFKAQLAVAPQLSANFKTQKRTTRNPKSEVEFVNAFGAPLPPMDIGVFFRHTSERNCLHMEVPLTEIGDKREHIYELAFICTFATLAKTQSNTPAIHACTIDSVKFKIDLQQNNGNVSKAQLSSFVAAIFMIQTLQVFYL